MEELGLKENKFRKKSMWMILVMLLLLTYGCQAEKVDDMKTAKLYRDLYTERYEIELDSEDVESLIGILNFEGTKVSNYSTGKDDYNYDVEVRMRNGKMKKYKIILFEDRRVYVFEMEDVETHGIKRREATKKWTLNSKQAEKVFLMPFFCERYPNAEFFKPLIWADECLDATNSSTDWEVIMDDGNWHCSLTKESRVVRRNSVVGDKLLIVYPGTPKEITYTVYDVDKNVVEAGVITDFFLDLPQKNGRYRYEIASTWENESVVRVKEDTYKDKLQGYRGTTHTVFNIDLTFKEAVNDSIEYDEEQLETRYVPVIETLDMLEYNYLVDVEGKSIRIKTNKSVSKSKLEVSIVSDKQNIKRTNFKIFVDGYQIYTDVMQYGELYFVEAEEFGKSLNLISGKVSDESILFKANDHYYPIEYSQNEREGYINNQGKWVLPPIYTRARKFVNGAAVVWIKDNKSEVDLSQHIVGADPSNFSSDFNEFLVDIYTPEIAGVINMDGKLLIPHVYEDIRPFNDGVAGVRKQGEHGYNSIINLNNEMISKSSYTSFGLFSEGVVPVECYNDDYRITKYGYVNKNGEIEIMPEFDFAREFHEGLATVYTGSIIKEEGKWGIIDRSGKYVVPPIFDYIESFSEGLARVQIGNGLEGRSGYIDTKGNFVLPPIFVEGTSFSEGYAITRLPDSEDYLYIDKKGEPLRDKKDEVIIVRHNNNGCFKASTDYKHTLCLSKYLFKEGRAVYGRNGRYGIIDKQGNIIVSAKFNQIDKFSDGLAFSKKRASDDSNGECYIDPKGKIIIPEILD